MKDSVRILVALLGALVGLVFFTIGVWQGLFVGVVYIIDGIAADRVNSGLIAWGIVRLLAITAFCWVAGWFSILFGVIIGGSD
jgi:hypothetical protein